jgi:ribosomal protein L30E
MAIRAGKLTIGFTPTKNALLQKQLVSIVTTSDISEGTLKKMLKYAEGVEVIKLPFTQYDIESVLRRSFVIAGISDINFMELLSKTLEEDI